MCIVDIIKQLSNAQGMSITTLEQTVGLGNGTIGKWRKQSPSCDKLKLVADYLSVSIDYLLTGEEKTSGTVENTTEQELLENYRKLSDFEKGEVLGDIKRRAANVEQVKKPNVRRIYQAARTYDHTPIDPYVDADISELYTAPDSTDEY